MTNFKTRGKEVTNNESPSKWLEVGTVQIVKLLNSEYFTTPTGSDGIKFTYIGKPVEGLNYDLNGNKVNTPKIEDTRWTTEKSWEYTQNVLIHMANILGCREQFDAAMDSVNTAADIANVINTTLANKAFGMVIVGEEIELTDKESGETSVWVKPTVHFSFPKYTASLTELGSLEEELDKLKNKDRVIKRLDKLTESVSNVSSTSTESTESLDW